MHVSDGVKNRTHWGWCVQLSLVALFRLFGENTILFCLKKNQLFALTSLLEAVRQFLFCGLKRFSFSQSREA